MDNNSMLIGGELPTHRMGFGAMRLTDDPGEFDRTASIALARRAVDHGVTFIDTADSYDLGDNETLLAEALYPYPDGVLIATKGGRINLGRDWFNLGRPEYLRQQAELSLRRLRKDHIDLYQLHRIDSTVPLADQLGALFLLQQQGKIRHVGLSEVTVDQLAEARSIVPIASVQNRYNITERASEDVLDYCARNHIAFIPYCPLGPVAARDAARLRPIAARLGASQHQVALAWLLRHSPVTLPIPGTSSQAHLDENIAAGNLALGTDDIAMLAS